jgi:hypothetical protein
MSKKMAVQDTHTPSPSSSLVAKTEEKRKRRSDRKEIGGPQL